MKIIRKPKMITLIISDEPVAEACDQLDFMFYLDKNEEIVKASWNFCDYYKDGEILKFMYKDKTYIVDSATDTARIE